MRCDREDRQKLHQAKADGYAKTRGFKQRQLVTRPPQEGNQRSGHDANRQRRGQEPEERCGVDQLAMTSYTAHRALSYLRTY